MPSSHRPRPSLSDPFSDSHYDRNGPRSAPLPPPKEDMLSAVRDSVTVKPVTDPKAKMARSHTASTTPGSATSPRTRRSHSSDSVPPPVDKSGKPTRPKASKKASMHADVIDRLDFSGVGAAMLHHDGPFDACAPSRNKHKTKAPMMAWGAEDNDPLSNVPDFSADRRLSPLAQSTLAAMNNYDSPYRNAGLYPGSPTSPDSMPKKRVDALAEAWGVAEPEPFEEFFAGGGDRSAASSIKNGKEGHSTSSSRRAKEAREAYRDYLDDGRPSRNARPRSTLPPPQPISLPGSRPHDDSTPIASSAPDAYDAQPQLSPMADNSPRRSKSLMQRIRKMRDAPNVPVSYQEEDEPSESGGESFESGQGTPTNAAQARPSHKHQNSFLGRFARSPNRGDPAISPISDTSERSVRSDEFVYVEDNASTRNKELPPPPGDYFGDAVSPGRGLGRKTSLMKKVVKGVRARGVKQ